LNDRVSQTPILSTCPIGHGEPAIGDAEGSFALTRAEHRRLAELLVRAARSGAPIEPLTMAYPEMTIADAASVRDMTIAQRVAAGELLVGAKVVYLDQPRLGWLTDRIVHRAGGVTHALSHPPIEAKLAVRVLEPLTKPPKRLSDLLERTSEPCGCSEIVDSRFGSTTVDVRDIVADNCSAGSLILHDAQRVPARVATLSAESLLWLAQELFKYQDHVEAQTILVSRPLEADV
jgi:2-keto-4-pentenoate hydratase